MARAPSPRKTLPEPDEDEAEYVYEAHGPQARWEIRLERLLKEPGEIREEIKARTLLKFVNRDYVVDRER